MQPHGNTAKREAALGAWGAPSKAFELETEAAMRWNGREWWIQMDNVKTSLVSQRRREGGQAVRGATVSTLGGGPSASKGAAGR